MVMTQENERLPLIDVLRGFAIIGTLGTNIWIFAHLGDLSFITTSNHSGAWAIDDLIRMAVLFLVNGKLLSLLAVMFGAGLEMKYRQSLRRGKAWPGTYIWICAFLLLEGIIHYILVMEYDILMSYAVTAIIVSFVVRGGTKAINRTLIFIGISHTFVIVLLFIGFVLNPSMLAVSYDSFAAIYLNGTWLEQIQFRLENFAYFRTEALFVIPMNTFLFLFGVKLMRSNAFALNEIGRRQRKRMLMIGVFAGLPLNALIFIPGGAFDLPVRYLFAPLMTVGYIGLIGKLLEYKKADWISVRLGQMGRVALSCYVLQNILASFIFYGWGLGFGGKLDSLGIIMVWMILSLVQFAFAATCLRYFKTGPMEGLRKMAMQSVALRKNKGCVPD